MLASEFLLSPATENYLINLFNSVYMAILIIFGSKTDEKTYNEIAKVLKKNKVDFELKISSAHKTPDEVDKLLSKDYSLIIAGAGLAAHLPGVCAARTIKPVIGVPCKGNYQGLDALLSIAQMPPGIPVLSVGVDKGEAAALNAVIMLKKYENVTIIGDRDNDASKKCIETLRKFGIPSKYSDNPDSKSINIEFTYFDEPIEKKDELVIYCPLLMKNDDKAEASINFLKHSTHGLWVGLNNGINAAIAAVEILNTDNSYEEPLLQYRRDMAEKIRKDNKEMG